LGILRIVAQQKDGEARGWWQDEHFCLLTTLDRAGLESFFLESYAPSPFVSPWNKGSGFYLDPYPALSPIEASSAQRFQRLRLGIAAGRAEVTALKQADSAVRLVKAKTKAKKGMTPAQKAAATALKKYPEYKRELAAAEKVFTGLKADMFTPCQTAWRGEHRTWMDAAMVLPDAGKPSWPSLLGTGGNDGRLDFTYNAMKRLVDLFDFGSADGHPRAMASGLLAQALWRRPSNEFVTDAPIGQFLPGGAGGANSTTGPSGDTYVNPWDFLLMLEGSILFSARSTRRLDPGAMARASAPFAVRGHAAGNATAGREETKKGEQWMPLWSQPATIPALQAMLGEARIQLGRQLADRPVDAARALSRLGMARGISSFQRFAYLQRYGDNNFAVPLGRINVQARPVARIIDDIANWLDRLHRLAAGDRAPARLVSAENQLANAVFAALTHDNDSSLWQGVLLAAASVEALQATGTAIKAGPIPALSPNWLLAADDGTVEWRLARALGSAAAGYDSSGRAIDPIRHHWLPLQPGSRRFLESDGRLMRDPRVIIAGRDAVADCVALVERRLIEGAQSGHRRLALVAAKGCAAGPADLAQLVAGKVDLVRLSGLARALMAVRWDQWRAPSEHVPESRLPSPDQAWMVLRLAALPWPINENRSIPVDPAIVRRLISGDAAGAVEVALRRLRAAGLRPAIRGASITAVAARLWAASLAFPITRRWARAMARQFDSTKLKEIR